MVMSHELHIPQPILKHARQLLTRLPFARMKLDALTHVLVTADDSGVTFAVSTLDQWLETRLDLPWTQPFRGTFLLPAAALAAAARAAKGSTVCLAPGGSKGDRHVTLRFHRGGVPVESMFPTLDPDCFTKRPEVRGEACVLPPATFAALVKAAPCISTDRARPLLNGVCFRPAEGGLLVAPDGKKLAVLPARVPAREFILPDAAVHLLGHADFLAGDTTVTVGHDPRRRQVCFESGNHRLVSLLIDGLYPDHRRPIPVELPHEAVIAPAHHRHLVDWLRSLRGRGRSVDLGWAHAGHLSLKYYDTAGNSASMTVPVRITGTPPRITFDPQHLAAALAIGPKLCLFDAKAPAVARALAGGAFCVLMPIRISQPQARPEVARISAA